MLYFPVINLEVDQTVVVRVVAILVLTPIPASLYFLPKWKDYSNTSNSHTLLAHRSSFKLILHTVSIGKENIFKKNILAELLSKIQPRHCELKTE